MTLSRSDIYIFFLFLFFSCITVFHLYNVYFFPTIFPEDHVWHLMCRLCACSCKINSCILKIYANESAWWTGLLAWNLITSVVLCANEFTFSSLYVSLFLSFTSHVPCNPLCGSMLWIWNLWRDSSKRQEKPCHSKHPAHILYTKGAVVCGERKKKSEEGNIAVLLILLFSPLIFPRAQAD